MTLPRGPERDGRIHPISQMIDELVAIFGDMGFAVADGPDIEDDLHNFTALNIPPEHPARQMHDTFYLLAAAAARRAPAAAHPHLAGADPHHAGAASRRSASSRPGRTYRSDSDATHTPMFHQVEGLVIDETTHMGHLKGCLIEFCRAFFELDDVPCASARATSRSPSPRPRSISAARARAASSRSAPASDWLEILGCGMVHPKVLSNCGLDPADYQGFAFGMGDRPARHAEIRHARSAHLLRRRSALAAHYGFLPLDVPTLRAAGVGAMKFTLSWLKDISTPTRRSTRSRDG